MYSKILIPLDGSQPSTLGLIEAIKIAKTLGSRVRLLHIVGELIFDNSYSPGLYLNTVIDALQDRGKAILNDAAARVSQQGLQSESVLLESVGGPAADLILAQAKEWPAELIVMETHGRRGIRRFALGSDAEQVLRATPVPILLVRGE